MYDTYSSHNNYIGQTLLSYLELKHALKFALVYILCIIVTRIAQSTIIYLSLKCKIIKKSAI